MVSTTQRLATDEAVVRRVREHIATGTTDLADVVWSEPVEHYLSEERFASELDVLRSVAGPGLTGHPLDQAVTAMARIPADGLRAVIDLLPSHDVRNRLGEITAPTLVVVGEHDAETPLAYSQVLADGIPDARLEVVTGAGHLTPAEAPEAVNRLLARFLPTTFSRLEAP